MNHLYLCHLYWRRQANENEDLWSGYINVESQYENRCKDAFGLQIFGLGILLEKHSQYKSIESILAVVNTTELVIEIRPEK